MPGRCVFAYVLGLIVPLLYGTDTLVHFRYFPDPICDTHSKTTQWSID